ncbi:hypothetical protein ACLQ3K_24955 [Tsukamurella sp. DT100]|uniref:hypothetical protein n=1 Tax=Tsukamurella sp. DT100 TaxID=3393415 RepID=UPI003CEBF928
MGVLGICLIGVAIIGAVLSVDLIRRPEDSWGLQEGWKWQDPDANRPSRSGMRFRAIQGLLAALVLAGAGVWIIVKYS